MPVGQGWSELVRKEGAAGWASATYILCKMGSKVLQIRTRGSPIMRFPLTHIPLIQFFATLQVRQGWSELVRKECAAGWASATSILCKMGPKPLQIHTRGSPITWFPLTHIPFTKFFATLQVSWEFVLASTVLLFAQQDFFQSNHKECYSRTLL